MTTLTRAVCRETGIKTVGLCHEVGNFTMDLAIALGKPWEAVQPSVTGVNHFPVLTALESRRRGRLRHHPGPGRGGRGPGLADPASGPGRGREVLQARFCPAACAEAEPPGALGVLSRRRGSPHRRVPLLRPHARVGLGRGLQHCVEPDRTSGEERRRGQGQRRCLVGRHEGPADLAVGRASVPDDRGHADRGALRGAGQHPEHGSGPRPPRRRRGRVDLRDRRRRGSRPRRLPACRGPTPRSCAGTPPPRSSRSKPPCGATGRWPRRPSPSTPWPGGVIWRQIDAMVDELLAGTAEWLPQFA